MPTLPTVGGSSNTWGTELNEFLDPVLDKFGAPTTAFEFSTSSLTGLTATTQTPDTVDADTSVPGCLYFNDNNSGSTSVCGRYATAPSAPFTAISLISEHNVDRNFSLCGIFIGTSTPGALISLGPGLAGSRMFFVRYTNPTTQGGTVEQGTYLYQSVYVAIRVNSSTSVDWFWSMEGRVWFSILAADNPGFTIGSVGLMLNSNASVASAIAYDYLRIWNSALTFV